MPKPPPSLPGGITVLNGTPGQILSTQNSAYDILLSGASIDQLGILSPSGIIPLVTGLYRVTIRAEVSQLSTATRWSVGLRESQMDQWPVLSFTEVSPNTRVGYSTTQVVELAAGVRVTPSMYFNQPTENIVVELYQMTIESAGW